MATTTLRQELIERFPEVEDDNDIISECIAVCQNYNLSAEDFWCKWEAAHWTPSNRAESYKQITLPDVKALKDQIRAEEAQKKSKEQKQQQKQRPGASATIFARKFATRTAPTPGVLSTVTGSTSSNAAKPFSLVKVTRPIDEMRGNKYRYMYEKISERSEVLDDRLDELSERVRDHYNLEELGDPSSSSEESVIVVGRICTNPNVEISSKLTDGEIFLETSRATGSGARVPLKFNSDLKFSNFVQGCGGAGLFPGAIVALKGKNGSGDSFVVEEIRSLPPLPQPSSTTEAGPEFSVLCACGPYTNDSDLNFDHLLSLLRRMESLKPSVLVLIGPFLDSAHPLLKIGDVDTSVQELFQTKIMDPLHSFSTSNPVAQIVLIPSPKDLLSDHPTLPQRELSLSTSDTRFTALPNPAYFDLNGVSFASTSVDTLFHIRNQEVIKRGEEVNSIAGGETSGNDLLANTCRHLLRQRSMYPIFPVPAELSAEVNLDVTHHASLVLDSAPEVLITPSRLKHFVKWVDGTIVVNPSFLTKGHFAVLIVKPAKSGKEKLSCVIHKLH